VLDHAKCVTDFAARLTAQLVHKRTHQEDATAADAQLGGIQVRHGCEVERSTLIEQAHFYTLGMKEALDLNGSFGMSTMGVADDVVYGFISRHHYIVHCAVIAAGCLAHSLHEGPRQGK
jgi:hypothetical protein